MRLKFYDGMYEVELKDNILNCYRNGEQWNSKEVNYAGDLFVHELVKALESAVDALSAISSYECSESDAHSMNSIARKELDKFF